MNRPPRHWDYDEYWRQLGNGSVHDLNDSAETEPSPAVLWVPDIDARHKWREHYVAGARKPSGKPMGFRRKGE